MLLWENDAKRQIEDGLTPGGPGSLPLCQTIRRCWREVVAPPVKREHARVSAGGATEGARRALLSRTFLEREAARAALRQQRGKAAAAAAAGRARAR